jgi:GNAT superfamily N-acetyltransferase
MARVIDVRPLAPEDRAGWETLARGYKDFYLTAVPPEGYDETWHRLLHDPALHALGAFADGRLIGIAHYLCHATVWSAEACYLQDLFVAADSRGRGAARALIARVADAAGEHGCTRYYWTTQVDNATARALYDRVAEFRGFIRYDHPV